MFTFTPLLGAQSSVTASQSLLELDGGIKILVDVGWSEDFDGASLNELEKHVSTLSFILLTHATTSHLGAYAHCCKHIPLFTRVPVYATEPVIALGRSLAQDIYSSTPLAASTLSASTLQEAGYSYPALRDGANSTSSSSILLQPPSQIEIAGYFSAIKSLKYSQPFEPTPSAFSPPLNGLTITAYNSGRTLGGTIWQVQHGQESIICAIDWSQAREHVLSGAAWVDPAQPSEVIESLRRPTALICSSRGSQRVAIKGGQKRRDEDLLSLIKGTTARGGTVLIPSDSSARVLELLYLLEDAWSRAAKESPDAFGGAKLYFASASGKTTTYNARRMLEWMDPNVQRRFENQALQAGRGKSAEGGIIAPFDFVYTKTIERKGQLRRTLTREAPKVIIASDSSFEWGFSRQVLEAIAADEKNLIVLSERASPVSDSSSGFGKAIWDVWKQKAGVEDYDAISQDPPTTAFTADGIQVKGRSAQIEHLTGNDLTLYQQYLARQRQMQDTVNTQDTTSVEASADLADGQSESSSDSEDEGEDEQQGRALNAAAVMGHQKHKAVAHVEVGKDATRRKVTFDHDVRGKRGRERLYPILKKNTHRDDEYGLSIKPEEYLRAEERDERNDDDTKRLSRKDTGVGEKRKWDEVGADLSNNKQKALNGTSKRSKIDSASPMDAAQDGELDDSEEDGEDREVEVGDKIEGPVKAVIGETTLTLHVRIAFIDFAGYHDKRSLQYLIPLIKPRKLILFGGEAKETAALATDCEQILHLEPGSGDIYMPLNGDVVDASVDTNSWTVKLSQPLYKKLRWQNVRGLGVVALSAFLLPTAEKVEEDEESESKKLKTAENEKENKLEVLPLLDTFSSAAITQPRSAAQPIHVGDIRLADLRRALQAEQYTAEFRGEGTLVINNSVAVRKNQARTLEVEGLLGVDMMRRLDPTFYNTRRKVYDMLAVVSGA